MYKKIMMTFCLSLPFINVFASQKNFTDRRKENQARLDVHAETEMDTLSTIQGYILQATESVKNASQDSGLFKFHARTLQKNIVTLFRNDESNVNKIKDLYKKADESVQDKNEKDYFDRMVIVAREVAKKF
jgi:hypothetical protein